MTLFEQAMKSNRASYALHYAALVGLEVHISDDMERTHAPTIPLHKLAAMFDASLDDLEYRDCVDALVDEMGATPSFCHP